MHEMTQISEQSTSTITVTDEDQSEQDLPAVRMKLRKPKNDKKVQWSNGTVDNEDMNKKKSKCCCIYEKPKKYDESSSEDEDECDHCQGHVERKKSKHPKQKSDVQTPISN